MILVCGEALIDLVPIVGAPEPTYAARPGGSLVNVAVGLDPRPRYCGKTYHIQCDRFRPLRISASACS